MSFSGTRLRIARLFKGYTQRQLANEVAIANGLLATYEQGDKEPKDDVLDALCSALLVRPSYFLSAHTDEFLEPQSNFRRRITAPDRLKRQVLARATMYGMAVRHLQNFGIFPSFNYPDMPAASVDDMERIADACRRYWQLDPDAPIGDLARVAENAGAVILNVDMETAERVDAFSRFGDVSVIVLNTQKDSTSRALFSLAHEIGHGVAHQKPRGLSLDQKEAEADAFASAFLLPREAFISDFLAHRSMDWEGLLDMKRYWRVSVQAILHRAYKLELIDAVEYRNRFKTLSIWGWRRDEPDEPTADMPSLFQKALDRARIDYGKEPCDLADDLGWTPELWQQATGVAAPRRFVGKVLTLQRRDVA